MSQGFHLLRYLATLVLMRYVAYVFVAAALFLSLVTLIGLSAPNPWYALTHNRDSQHKIFSVILLAIWVR